MTDETKEKHYKDALEVLSCAKLIMEDEDADVEDEDSCRNEEKDSDKMSPIHFLV